MTDSEATKLMFIEKECINRDCDRDCANCDIVQKVEDLNNAYDISINALEKQIAKKVTGEKDKFNTPHWYCSVCGCELYSGQTHCDDCGQKLDWSEV